MKTLYSISSSLLIVLILQACSSSYAPYAYDDVYYSPNNDPVKQVQKNPREDFNKTDNIQYDGNYQNRYSEDEKSADYPQSLYRNRYTEAEQEDNARSENGETNITINNNNSDEVQYYDEDYALTLERINSPVRSFNTYDPYTRDRILYTHDPFFCTPTLYGRYTFWDPFVPRTGFSVGYNSWSGWNVGVGIGFGYSNWGYAGYPFYDPFYDPFFGPFWGYNRWNPYNPWGYGYGFNNYWAGYNQGFYNGYYYGNNAGFGNYIVGGSDGSGSGRRYIKSPRGNSGSTTYRKSGESVPTRSSRTNPSMREKDNAVTTGTRPSRTNSRSSIPSNKSEESLENVSSRPTRTSTPEKYKIDRTPESYTRPEPNNSRPTREPTITNTPSRRSNMTTPTQPDGSNDMPNYSRPMRNNTYNRSNRVQPQRNRSTTVRPQRQNSPSYNNRSRPSFNNTPSYRPSGGGGSSPSRSTRPRR